MFNVRVETMPMLSPPPPVGAKRSSKDPMPAEGALYSDRTYSLAPSEDQEDRMTPSLASRTVSRDPPNIRMAPPPQKRYHPRQRRCHLWRKLPRLNANGDRDFRPAPHAFAPSCTPPRYTNWPGTRIEKWTTWDWNFVGGS